MDTSSSTKAYWARLPLEIKQKIIANIFDDFIFTRSPYLKCSMEAIEALGAAKDNADLELKEEAVANPMKDLRGNMPDFRKSNWLLVSLSRISHVFGNDECFRPLQEAIGRLEQDIAESRAQCTTSEYKV